MKMYVDAEMLKRLGYSDAQIRRENHKARVDAKRRYAKIGR